MTKLQAGLAAELRARGFKLEDRRYTPHLTLAREVRGEAEPELVLPEPVPALVRGASPYALGAQTGSFDLYSAALLRLCALTRRRRSCYDDWYGRRREHEGI